MQVNAAICAQCGLLRRDFTPAEDAKTFPTCTSCLQRLQGQRDLEERQLSDTHMTCTRCGVIRHATAHFPEAERLKASPCCRHCLAGSSSLITQQRSHGGGGEILSKRKQRADEKRRQAEREANNNPFDFDDDDNERTANDIPAIGRKESSDDSSSESSEEKKTNDPPEQKTEAAPKKPCSPAPPAAQQPNPFAPQRRGRKDPIEEMYKNLVKALLHPDRQWGVPEELRQPLPLYQHVRRVLDVHNDQIAWLVKPLIDGLTQATPALINARVCMGTQNPVLYSLLAWTCHFYYLQQACGWQGREDVVRFVLATPGIQVNDVFFNKTHAGFFAVVYASPETLELLLQAGLDVAVRDLQHRSLLYHALEYPHPRMLRHVLNHVDLNADEDGQAAAQHLLRIGAAVVAALHQQKQEQQGTTASSRTRTSRLLHHQQQQQTQQAPAPQPECWKHRGAPPSVEDVAESLIVVRQRGAKLLSLSDPPKVIQEVRIALKQLSRHLNSELVKSLTGQWLPESIQDRVFIRCQDQQTHKTAATGDEAVAVQPCTIHALDPNKKFSLLACGHVYCPECVWGYNRQNEGRLLCPVCSRRLSRDVLGAFCAQQGPERLQKLPSPTVLGTGDDTHDYEHEQLKSLSILSDTQVVQETKCQGIYSLANHLLGGWSLREKLLLRVLEGHLQKPRQSGGMNTVLDLTATHTHIVTGQAVVTTAPRHGPVAVEVWIQGVPLLAHLSNHARFTLVSEAVVENFHLPLSDRGRIRGTDVACLEAFTFSLIGHGGKPVEVTLHNAVQAPESILRGRGVQLGLDFFGSATFCAADVLVETGPRDQAPVPVRCDGLYTWDIPAAQQKHSCLPPTQVESLRYYSRTGEMACLPLFHFNPQRHDEVDDTPALFTMKHTMFYEECHWCGRVFHKGSNLSSCKTCVAKGLYVRYCDDKCKAAAATIHRVTCGKPHLALPTPPKAPLAS